MASTVLFDLDGTLTDNYPGIARSIAYALDAMDVGAPSPDVLRRCVGPPLRESFAWLLDTSDREVIERAIALYRERYGDVGWRENVVYEGIEDAVGSLAATTPVFVCTSKPEVFATRIVTLFGLSPHIKRVYGADLHGAFDDKAKLLAHAARSEGFDPAHAILVGDRSHDIRAARMNGARSIGVLWGYGSHEELAQADVLVAAPADLPGAIAKVRGA
ncbi:MAG: HAD hydrolase-like protein [Burkholderiales bacterium]